MYNWDGRSNKEKEVLFIQRLLGRDTSSTSLAQYGEFIPVEGSSEPDDKLIYYKDIVESIEITGSLRDNPDVYDTKVINFVTEDEGHKIESLVESYGKGTMSSTCSDVVFSNNPSGIILNSTYPYLWNKTDITLSDGSSDTSYKLIASYNGDSSGSLTVNRIIEYYAVYPYNTYPPADVKGTNIGEWDTSSPIGLSIDNRYVWNYDEIYFDNSQPMQGGYYNAMIIGDYGNQIREVVFNDATESDYTIVNGRINADETWWNSRGILGKIDEWDHVADITQIQINDVVVIRGISDVTLEDGVRHVDCETLVNAKVTQITNSSTTGEFKIDAITLNYFVETPPTPESIYVHLTNSSGIIPADEHGTPTVQLPIPAATTIIELYQGGIKVTGIPDNAYSATISDPSHCTGDWVVESGHKTGAYYINTISTDSVTVTLSITYDEQTYSAVFPVTLNKQGSTGESAKFVDSMMSSQTFNIDYRRSDANPTITLGSNVQGYTGVELKYQWTGVDANGLSINSYITHSPDTSNRASLDIPYNIVSFKSPFTITLVVYTGSTPLDDVISTKSESLTGIDITEYDHDFGAWEPEYDSGTWTMLPIGYVNPITNVRYGVLDGDFFVVKTGFFINYPTQVSPQSTDDPKENGWFEVATGSSPLFYIETQDTYVVQGKSYYVPSTTGSNLSTYYKRGVAYYRSSGDWYNELTATTENSAKMLKCLGSVLSNPNIQPYEGALYGWFRDLTVLNAVIENLTANTAFIDSLFSKNINVLDPGYIQSSNYIPESERNICEYDLSEVYPGSFSLDEDTFVNSTWGYGTYKIECTRAYKSNPQSSEGTDDGEWSIMKDNVQMATTSDCDGLEYYGISIYFDGEGSTTNVGNYFTIVSSKQTIQGQGFYLGSDGAFNCNNANANNLVITGKSFFSGSFECAAIKTVMSSPDVPQGATATAQTSGSNWQMNQARLLYNALNSLGYGTVMIACRLQNITSDIAYFSLDNSTDSGNYGYCYRVKFYKSDGTMFDLRTIPSLGMSYVDGGQTLPDDFKKWVSFRSSQYTWDPTQYSYSTNGFTVEILVGGNALLLDIPSSSVGLDTGMVFRGTTKPSGIDGYPLYVKA